MNEEYRNKIIALVNWRKDLKTTEGLVEEYYWKPLTEILSKNEEETIIFLNECDNETLYWISEVFEDVSENLQSKKFIKELEQLQKKYPDVDMEQDIQCARYAIED